MELNHSCATCDHYYGDGYCSLPRDQRKLSGYIQEAESVVCVRHEPRLTVQESIDKAAADEERPLYRHPRY